MNQLKDKTVIIITHKSQVLKAVDKIILLENGSIADVGTQGELYSRNNGYRDILDNYDPEQECQLNLIPVIYSRINRIKYIYPKTVGFANLCCGV